MYCVVLTIRDGDLIIGMGIPDNRNGDFVGIVVILYGDSGSEIGDYKDDDNR